MTFYPGFVTSVEEVDGEKVSKIVEDILDVFSAEKTSCTVACHILDLVKEAVADRSVVQSLERRKS